MFIFFILFFLVKADVWVESGNMSLDFVDINLDDNLNIKRTYNSQNDSSSLFSKGWGFEYELRIKPVLGVMLLVENYSTGSKNFYIQKKDDALNKVITEIIKTENKDETLVENLKKRLVDNELLLSYFINKKNIYKEPDLDAEFYATDGTNSKIIYKKDAGYIRQSFGGKLEEFNRKGLLTAVKYEADNFIKFVYDKGQLVKMFNQKGTTLKFTYGENGLLSKVCDDKENKCCSYVYGTDSKLIESDANNEAVYTYEYDTYFNLTKLLKDGKAIREYKYDSQTDRVTSYIDDKACVTNYFYSNDKNKEFLYSLTKVKKYCKNNLEEQKSYEYWYKYLKAGGIYLQKHTVKEGVNTYSIIYNETGKLPLLVNENKKITSYFYDSLNRLIKKRFSDGKFLELTYQDDKIIKINKNGNPYYYAYDILDRIYKITYGDNTIMIDFDKSSRARLIRDEQNGVFLIDYDGNGRIVKISSADGELSLAYDSKGSLILNKIIAKQNIDKFRKVYVDYLSAIGLFNKTKKEVMSL